MEEKIRIGTSSWADPGFVEEWYPPGLPARDRLPFYAERFDAVEVNSTFYAVPGAAQVRRWAEVTPAGFSFDVKLHLVWITKYRKKLLRGDVGVRLRQIVRTICAEPEVEILKGHVSVDHVHLFVSCPPHVSASYLMQRVKGKSSRRLMQEYSHLKRVRPRIDVDYAACLSHFMQRPGTRSGRSCSRTGSNAPSCTSDIARSTPPPSTP